jgi:hypothetical protein
MDSTIHHNHNGGGRLLISWPEQDDRPDLPITSSLKPEASRCAASYSSVEFYPSYHNPGPGARLKAVTALSNRQSSRIVLESSHHAFYKRWDFCVPIRKVGSEQHCHHTTVRTKNMVPKSIQTTPISMQYKVINKNM